MAKDVDRFPAVSRRVPREEYEAALPDLRMRLLNAQFDLASADHSVLAVIAGTDRWGCNEAVDLLHEWLDARHIDTRFFGPLDLRDRALPRFARYWTELPAQGRLGVFLGAWTAHAVGDRAAGRLSRKQFARRIARIRRFEEALCAGGTRIVKLWLHLPKGELKKRLHRHRKDPGDEWQVDDTDRWLLDRFDRAVEAAGELIDATDAPDARWITIDARHRRTRDLRIGRTVLDALKAGPASAPAPVDGEPAPPSSPGALAGLDLSAALEREEYRRRLERWQRRLHVAVRRMRAREGSAALVFEGADAAGKGGAIRRITGALPARDYQVIPIAAPSEEERAHHYLWRFWRQLPEPGRIVIFDRSWYGRVLVERVEGFADESEWRRAYGEIRDFEEQLTDHGIVVVKFWLHIDPDEQLRRFEAREKTPYKKHKITDEDYRNRAKWDAYVDAVDEMVARTSTDTAPWRLVPANNKRYARIDVLRAVCRALEASFGKGGS